MRPRPTCPHEIGTRGVTDVPLECLQGSLSFSMEPKEATTCIRCNGLAFFFLSFLSGFESKTQEAWQKARREQQHYEAMQAFKPQLQAPERGSSKAGWLVGLAVPAVHGTLALVDTASPILSISPLLHPKEAACVGLSVFSSFRLCCFVLEKIDRVKHGCCRGRKARRVAGDADPATLWRTRRCEIVARFAFRMRTFLVQSRKGDRTQAQVAREALRRAKS